MTKAQHNAYIKQMHRYDALMTGRSWWGHLFNEWALAGGSATDGGRGLGYDPR